MAYMYQFFSRSFQASGHFIVVFVANPNNEPGQSINGKKLKKCHRDTFSLWTYWHFIKPQGFILYYTWIYIPKFYFFRRATYFINAQRCILFMKWPARGRYPSNKGDDFIWFSHVIEWVTCHLSDQVFWWQKTIWIVGSCPSAIADLGSDLALKVKSDSFGGFLK